MTISARLFHVLIAAIVAATFAFLAFASGGSTELAGAQGPAKPKACAGNAFTDTAGDQGIEDGLIPSGANTDVLSGYLSHENGSTTANVVIADLNKTVPGGYQALTYYFAYTLKEDPKYAAARVTTNGEVTYSFGTIDGNRSVQDGETKGAFIEGKDGVVSIVLPAAAGGALGTKLDAPNGIAYQTLGPGPSLLLPADTTDDGKSTTIPNCSGPAAPPAGTPAPTPGAVALPITVNPKAGSAKSSSKKKKATFSLTSQGEVTGITGTLLKGSKVVGSGTLAKINGTAKLTAKLKSAVKKGAYTLKLSGTPAGGAKSEKTYKVSFGK